MIALAALLAVLIAILHLASGSAMSELGAHPDEAAHFVTGLMVRDYLVHGLHESPLRYADEYYRHYPKIGLGVWPPFFYVIQAAWTLVFPAVPGSILWLMAALELALAMVTAWWLWREMGWAEAVAGAVLLAALPLVQQYGNMVMAEMLSALLMFGAIGFFACYMEEEKWGDAIGFGILAGLAIMTKGTGLALALVPALAIGYTRRFSMLRRPSLWVAAALVIVIAGPWTWHFRNEGRGGWEEPSPSMHFTQAAVAFYSREIIVAVGGMLSLLALAGVVALLLGRGRKPAIAVCSLALVLAVLVFQSITPVGLEARHLMPAMPAMIILAMLGLRAITRRCCPRYRIAAAAGLLILVLILPAIFPPTGPQPGYGSIGKAIHLSPFRIPAKRWGGFAPVAAKAMAAGPAAKMLVASDARGEGMFIADVASRDNDRPAYTVERASKILASSTWSGSGYQSLYQTPAQVRDALQQAGITLVVTDASAPQTAHDSLLAETVGAGSGFALLGEWTVYRDGIVPARVISLYRAPWTAKQQAASAVNPPLK
jgi:hypothetical protein